MKNLVESYLNSLMREKNTTVERDILKLMFPEDSTEAIRFLGHQINVLDNMGQGLMSLGGILLAITASLLPTLHALTGGARFFIVTGASFVLASILCNSMFVFRVRWITEMENFPSDHGKIIDTALKIRSNKTRAYHIALAIMIIGLLCYLMSIYVLALS